MNKVGPYAVLAIGVGAIALVEYTNGDLQSGQFGPGELIEIVALGAIILVAVWGIQVGF
jgi:hypothetical protein